MWSFRLETKDRVSEIIAVVWDDSVAHCPPNPKIRRLTLLALYYNLGVSFYFIDTTKKKVHFLWMTNSQTSVSGEPNVSLCDLERLWSFEICTTSGLC